MSKEKKQKEKKRTTPFGINLGFKLRSQVL